MIVVLSPSKTMDMTPAPVSGFSEPVFLERSAQLIDVLRDFSVEQLMERMQISPKLGALNAQRFADWHLPFTLETAKQALFAFSGDVYDGLSAQSLGPAEVAYANEHLRILSGLYGLLRPLDLIMPYRLEMGRKVAVGEVSSLYAFWREMVTAELNRSEASVLVNLASQEYFKVINPRALTMDVVTPVFKDEKGGKLKVISFYAKKARGRMARFVVENRVTKPADLLAFSADGYGYDSALSTEASPVFVRVEPR